MKPILGWTACLSLVAGCMPPSPPGTLATEPQQDALTARERGLLGSSARLWRATGQLDRCGTWRVDEDYSSGRYNVHRYRVTAPAGGQVVLSLRRTAGRMQPALLLATEDGLWVGQAPPSGLSAVITRAGRGGDVHEIELNTDEDRSVDLYVTGWSVADADFAPGLDRDVRYRLEVHHRCPRPVPTGTWVDVHDGLQQGGAAIPRAGVANRTLEGALGVAVEPDGEVVLASELRLVRGTVSHFGGPSDTGVTPTETGAITGERLRDLNDPLSPDAAALRARPDDFYYVAMRFDYANGGRAFWRSARILVVAPDTGRAVVVRPVDWGPHTRTGRIIDLSPQALVDLGLSTDDPALVAFARAGTPLGPVEVATPPAEPPAEPPPVEPPPAEPPPAADPCPDGVICLDALPFTGAGDTSGRASRFDRYGCAPDVDESGPEVVYQIEVPSRGLLTVDLPTSPADVDVDVHILSDLDPAACLDRGHWRAARLVTPGRYYVVVDSWRGSDGTSYEGAYTLAIQHITPDAFAAQGLEATVFDQALHAFDVAWQRDQTEDLTFTVIDFSRRSTLERLWVLDLARGQVDFRLHTSHGRGSANPNDAALSDRFSNANGSNRSSLGLSKTAEIYTGSKGYSLRFDGLEPGYNDNMRARAIVMHGATYARAEVTQSQDYLGRSLGCPAIDDRVVRQVIDRIAGGSLLFSWYPDGDWSANSNYLR